MNLLILWDRSVFRNMVVEPMFRSAAVGQGNLRGSKEPMFLLLLGILVELSEDLVGLIR